jgi:hypothetical protein
MSLKKLNIFIFETKFIIEAKRSLSDLKNFGLHGVESLLICVFLLAPRDQLRQRNEPATSQAAGYPKQPATPVL